MLPARLADVVAADLLRLVTAGVRESEGLDFKRTLPGGSDADKVKFLRNVTALANRSGGDIVFGVVEDDAVAKDVVGLEGLEFDKTEQWFRNLIANCVEPHLHGVEVRMIEGFDHGKPAVVVRVPVSWARPHAVRVGNHFRFYTRHGTVNLEMSVMDLRVAFAASDELPRRVRAFREDRINAVDEGRAPIPVSGKEKLLIHVVPANAMDPRTLVDVHRLDHEHELLQVIDGSSFQRFNLDGYVRYSGGNRSAAYAMMFRTGALEALIPNDTWVSTDDRKWYSRPLEEALLRYLPTYISTVEKLGGSRPLFVMLTVIRADGYRLGMGPEHGPGEFTFDRPVLRVPEVVIDDAADPDVVEALMNSLWQCAGLSDRRAWAKPDRPR